MRFAGDHSRQEIPHRILHTSVKVRTPVDSSRLMFTISILPNTMRRCVRDEYDHLARVRSPVHVQRLGERGRDSLGPVAATRGVQAREVLVHVRDVR